MKKQKLFDRLKDGLHEAAAIDRGEATAGRVWVVNRRPDGTVERRQVDPADHRCERAAATTAAAPPPENEALVARGKLGLSQDRFARLLGISAGTLRGWEQGRRRPSGAARLLLRVAARHPKAILACVEAPEADATKMAP